MSCTSSLRSVQRIAAMQSKLAPSMATAVSAMSTNVSTNMNASRTMTSGPCHASLPSQSQPQTLGTSSATSDGSVRSFAHHSQHGQHSQHVGAQRRRQSSSAAPSSNAPPGSSGAAMSGRFYESPFAKWYESIQRNETFLGNGATEFRPPPVTHTRSGVPEHAMRFKTTSYGRLLREPFVMPNEHKVTLQIQGKHLPFTADVQRHIFKEIVGARYNDETDVLKLSSAQFGSRIENKRHVVSMLDRIVDATKGLSHRVEEEMEQHKVTTASSADNSNTEETAS